MKDVLFILFLSFLLPGCPRGGQEQPASEKPSVISSPRSIPEFSGERAFSLLRKQTSFGPRNPNSAGHLACLEWLSSELGKLAPRVELQPFTHSGYNGEQLALTNVIASFNPASADRILLCAHWDTRPRAERDENPARRNEPILGANDGASGVAVLLEIARLLAAQPPSVGVDIVLFDGEDYGKEEDLARYLLGSRHFALNVHPDSMPRFGILLDMVGDTFLDIPREAYSVRYAPDIVELVWNTARQLGRSEFIDAEGESVYDDHLPLNEVGIKTINLIDFNYPDPTNRYWHTHQDTPEHCSAASLEAVGSVLTHLVYSEPR